MNTKTELIISTGFLDSAAALPKEVKSSLIKALNLLAQDVRHPSLQCKKVSGSRATVYECRVDQRVRLIYDLHGGRIRCWYVGVHDVALRFATKYSQAQELIVDDIQVDDVPLELRSILEFLMDGRSSVTWDVITVDALVPQLTN